MVCLSVYPLVSQSVSQLVSLPICLSVSLPVSQSVFRSFKVVPSVSPSHFLSFSLPPSLLLSLPPSLSPFLLQLKLQKWNRKKASVDMRGLAAPHEHMDNPQEVHIHVYICEELHYS